jgi:hypothetical protein
MKHQNDVGFISPTTAQGCNCPPIMWIDGDSVAGYLEKHDPIAVLRSNFCPARTCDPVPVPFHRLRNLHASVTMHSQPASVRESTQSPGPQAALVFSTMEVFPMVVQPSSSDVFPSRPSYISVPVIHFIKYSAAPLAASIFDHLHSSCT